MRLHPVVAQRLDAGHYRDIWIETGKTVMTFEGYEAMGFSVEFPDRKKVIKHTPSGWRLKLAKSYPMQEQMADFSFSREDPNAPDILVGIFYYTADPRSAGVRAIKIERLEGIAHDAWSAGDLEILLRMLLIEEFPTEWREGQPVPPHEFIVAPESWPHGAHFTPVHSLEKSLELS